MTTKKKVGRPKFIIDYKVVEKLASIMCTIEEIASYLGCHRDTLHQDKEFTDVYKKGLDNGRMSLRRTQYRLSEKNVAMAIFLGKNYLNQSDRQEITTTEKPIIVDNIPNDKTN